MFLSPVANGYGRFKNPAQAIFTLLIAVFRSTGRPCIRMKMGGLEKRTARKPRAANGAEQGDYSDFARRSTAVIRPSADTVE